MLKAALVLGVVGAVLGLPGAVCAGACAAGLTGASNIEMDDRGNVIDRDPDNAESDAAGNTFMLLGVIGSVLAFVGAIKVTKPGRMGAHLLLVGTIMNGMMLVTFNPLSLLVGILLLLATVMAYAGGAAETAAPAA